jgi:hypothetical protein
MRRIAHRFPLWMCGRHPDKVFALLRNILTLEKGKPDPQVHLKPSGCVDGIEVLDYCSLRMWALALLA